MKQESKKIIHVDSEDKTKQIECGKLVQAGKLRQYGYANGKYLYIEI